MVFMMTQQFTNDQGAELSNPPPPRPPPPSDCPRCGSTNTKFCYYNNYNKSQPRHFCKSCKRHWTNGGTLRNIPAGRRRKNKRPRPSTTTAAAAEPRQKHFHNSLSLSADHKSMPNILFQALINSSSPSTTDCFNFSIPQGTILESNGTTTTNYNADPNTEFITFSNFTSSTSIPTFNYQSSNDDYVVNYAVNLDSTEESTVTTSAPPPLPAENYSTAAVDVADLWRWNEIDSLSSSAWDHNFDLFKTFLEDSYRC